MACMTRALYKRLGHPTRILHMWTYRYFNPAMPERAGIANRTMLIQYLRTLKTDPDTGLALSVCINSRPASIDMLSPLPSAPNNQDYYAFFSIMKSYLAIARAHKYTRDQIIVCISSGKWRLPWSKLYCPHRNMLLGMAVIWYIYMVMSNNHTVLWVYIPPNESSTVIMPMLNAGGLIYPSDWIVQAALTGIMVYAYDRYASLNGTNGDRACMTLADLKAFMLK